jgi:hypothetical protein
MNTDNRFPLEDCFKAVDIVVGVCREDNPRDVDEAYGPGTYERLFPDPGNEHGAHETLEEESDMERDRR